MPLLPQEECAALRAKSYNATVLDTTLVRQGLVILRIKPDAGMQPHQPGQYTTLGLGHWETSIAEAGPEEVKPEQLKKLLRRAYSMSHPILNPKTGALLGEGEVDFYEFYVSLITNTSGTPTSPRLTPRLFNLKKGDRLLFGPKVTGHYIVGEVQPTDQLLFFSTGTGEAPHNAMIWQLLTRGHRGPIVSVVCTRYRSDQAYRATHEKLAKLFPQYHVIYLATREKDEPKLYCQDLIQNGSLEKQTGIEINAKNTHVYLCGNPSMIGRPEVVEGKKIYPQPIGIIEILEKKGFSIHMPTQHGNIHFEAYW